MELLGCMKYRRRIFKFKLIGIDIFRFKVNFKGVGFLLIKSFNLCIRKIFVGSVICVFDVKIVVFVLIKV